MNKLAGKPQDIFRMFRHQLKDVLFIKSKYYYPDMKRVWNKQLRADAHHLAGSYFGKKTTDFLIIPLPHTVHIEKAEKQKALYFVMYLLASLNHLRTWCLKHGAKKTDVEITSLSPDIVIKIIKVAVTIEERLLKNETN